MPGGVQHRRVVRAVTEALASRDTGFVYPFLGQLIDAQPDSIRWWPVGSDPHLAMARMRPTGLADSATDADQTGLAALATHLRLPGSRESLHQMLPAVPAGSRTLAWAMGWSIANTNILCHMLIVDVEGTVTVVDLDTTGVTHEAPVHADHPSMIPQLTDAVAALRELVRATR